MCQVEFLAKLPRNAPKQNYFQSFGFRKNREAHHDSIVEHYFLRYCQRDGYIWNKFNHCTNGQRQSPWRHRSAMECLKMLVSLDGTYHSWSWHSFFFVYFSLQQLRWLTTCLKLCLPMCGSVNRCCKSGDIFSWRRIILTNFLPLFQF